ncbi:MAG: DUF3108 domain-containing protein [Ectothiorhodospiraceae bacterium]|jgi:hypothetical protein
MCGAAVSGDAAAMQDFSAQYGVSYGFVPLGSYRLTLTLTDDGGYRYESDTDPNPLVSLFADKRVVELSEGRWTPHGPVPRRYVQRVRKDGGWSKRVVEFGDAPRLVVDGVAQSLNTPSGALDPAGLLLQIIHDVSAGRMAAEYKLVDEEGKVRDYRTEDLGEETVRALDREWTTRHIRRVGGNPRYGLEVYLAPALNGLPVRIVYLDKGRRFKAVLEDVNGVEAPGAGTGAGMEPH